MNNANTNAITITQTIAARTVFQVPGAFFRLVDASAAVDVELINGGRILGTLENFLAGVAVDGADFDAVAITPAGATDIQIVIADAAVRYDRFSGSVDVVNTGGAYTRAAIAAQDAVTAGTLFAANASRRMLAIQNNSASVSIRVRLDGTAPTTSTGLKIAPGGYWETPAYCATGAVKVIAESGTAAIEGLEG